jgi:transcriptional regulator with XRE-family HTH domain
MLIALKRSGISKAEIARRLGITPQAVNGWFKTGTIQKRNLAAFARETQSDLGWLMEGADNAIAPQQPSSKPTLMGERIIAFMVANNVVNHDEFAEGILGISVQQFKSWLYEAQETVDAKPLLRCADALNTNAEYLLGESDDPRPQRALEWPEHQLLQAFRDLNPDQQELLLTTATAWHLQLKTPSTAHPFLAAVPVRTGKDDDK